MARVRRRVREKEQSKFRMRMRAIYHNVVMYTATYDSVF